MKRRHTIDKFGRTLTHAYRLDDDAVHIDVGNKRLRFVADPVDSHESVNKRYLERLHIPLEHRVKLLESKIKQLQVTPAAAGECLMLSADKKSWDAKGLRIGNVAAAEQMEDVSRLSQTCTYDSKENKFKVGTQYYDLVVNTAEEPAVVATKYTTFAPLEFTAYKRPSKPLIPTYSTRWKSDENKMVDSKNLEIVWNEVDKKFAYRRDMTTW